MIGGHFDGGLIKPYNKKNGYVKTELKYFMRSDSAYVYENIFFAKDRLHICIYGSGATGYTGIKRINVETSEYEQANISFMTDAATNHIYTNENNDIQYFDYNRGTSLISYDFATNTSSFVLPINISSSNFSTVYFNGKFYKMIKSTGSDIAYFYSVSENGGAWVIKNIQMENKLAFTLLFVYNGNLYCLMSDYYNSRYNMYLIDTELGTLTLFMSISDGFNNSEAPIGRLKYFIKNDKLYCLNMNIHVFDLKNKTVSYIKSDESFCVNSKKAFSVSSNVIRANIINFL